MVELTKKNLIKSESDFVSNTEEDQEIYRLLCDFVWDTAKIVIDYCESKERNFEEILDTCEFFYNKVCDTMARIVSNYLHVYNGECTDCESPFCPISPEYDPEAEKEKVMAIIDGAKLIKLLHQQQQKQQKEKKET